MDRTWQEFLRELEQVRAVAPQLGTELRAEGDGDGEPEEGFLPETMAGHFSVFNRWYEVNSIFEGRFFERIAPGAFERTIDAHFGSNDGRIKVLFGHGMDFHVGDKVLGPIRTLEEDRVGPAYEVPLFDTSYNRDLVPGLRAGEYGSSFRFRVIKDEWNDEPGRSEHNPDGIPERTIREVRVFEFGPVTFPANPDATAGVRSMTDDFYDRIRERNPDRYDELLARAREIRTPDGGPAAGTPPDGPASTQPTDSPSGTRRTPKHAAQMLRRTKAKELKA